MLYDPAKRNGKLYEKLIYQQRKLKETNDNQCVLHGTNDDIERDTEITEMLLKIFQNCILPRDKDNLLEHLRKSCGVRLRCLENERKILQSSFHLYLVFPNLVILFFIYFKHVIHIINSFSIFQVSINFTMLFHEVDANSMLSPWSTIRKKPRDLLKVSLEGNDKYHMSDDVHDLLMFLKVFPTHRVKFESAVNSLMIFSNVVSISKKSELQIQLKVKLFFRMSHQTQLQ